MLRENVRGSHATKALTDNSRDRINSEPQKLTKSALAWDVQTSEYAEDCMSICLSRVGCDGSDWSSVHRAGPLMRSGHVTDARWPPGLGWADECGGGNAAGSSRSSWRFRRGRRRRKMV